MRRIQTLAFSALCLALLSAQADNFTLPETPKHLLPLDGRGIDLYEGYERFLETVISKQDNELSSIYIWPASKPGVYIGIYRTKDESSYYLEYALDTKPAATFNKMMLTASNAASFSEKLKKVIATDTRYPSDGRLPILCADGTWYVFESSELYGEATCPADGTAAKLEQFADELVGIAELKGASDETRNQKIAELVSMLDALGK